MKKVVITLLLIFLLAPIFANGEQETTPSQIQNSEQKEAIVVYFSATGNTKKVAENIAEKQKCSYSGDSSARDLHII